MNAKQTHKTSGPAVSGKKKMKFADIIADPAVRERWEKVRAWFFLRESTYDMTNRCNIRCDGCYYFEGDKQFAKENGNPDDWRALMEAEKARGITYVVLAGAEPSLVPELCQICYDVIPLGSIATNGFRRIPESVGYKIHISVWGNDETSLRIRSAKDLLLKQIENYRGDPRAVWVYTFTTDTTQARLVSEMQVDAEQVAESVSPDDLAALIAQWEVLLLNSSSTFTPHIFLPLLASRHKRCLLRFLISPGFFRSRP